MIRRLIVLGVGASLLGLVPLGPSPAGSAAAAVVMVDVGPGSALTFDPTPVTIAVGDTVQWEKLAGAGPAENHNVRDTTGVLFRSGDPTDAAFTYSVVFAAGRFPYFCEVHQLDGMTGLIKVPTKLLKKPAGPKFRARWATKASGTETLASVDPGWVYDVKYKIGGGKWKNWFVDTAKLTAVFGKNKNPVPVKKFEGKVVRIRSRTQDEASGLTSGWSPVRKIRAT